MIRKFIDANEEIIWQGMPNKAAWQYNRYLHKWSKNFPGVVLGVLIIVSGIVFAILPSGNLFSGFLLVAFGMVCIAVSYKWIKSILGVNKYASNSKYIITDKRVISIMSGRLISINISEIVEIGVQKVNVKSKYEAEILVFRARNNRLEFAYILDSTEPRTYIGNRLNIPIKYISAAENYYNWNDFGGYTK